VAKATLRTIADTCGVSTSTVSRALANHPAVLPATRERIAAAARRHGYTRNDLIGQVMSHLRVGGTQRFVGNLALIHVPSPGQPRLLPSQRHIIAGAQARAKALGFQLYEFSLGGDGLDVAGYARVIRARGVQGIIFLYSAPSSAMADFPRHDYAMVEIDFGQREPVLHTVCLDHHLTLTTSLARLHQLGYRRFGLFVTRFKDQRIEHRWSGSFASFQRHAGGVGKVPILIADEINESAFIKWYRAHRPDLVIGHLDEAIRWLERARVQVPEKTAFFNLNWNDRHHPCAGIDVRLELQGSVAVETLIAQIQRGERGLPENPRTIMVKGSWMDGPSLRRSET
jgi:LacI family transcriptional regulator